MDRGSSALNDSRRAIADLTAKAFPSGLQVISPSVLGDHDWTGELVVNKADLYRALARYLGVTSMAKKKQKPTTTAEADDLARLLTSDRALNLGSIMDLLPEILIALRKAQAIVAAEGDAAISLAIDEFAAVGIKAIEVGVGKDILNDAEVLAATKEAHEAFYAIKNAIVNARARRTGV